MKQSPKINICKVTQPMVDVPLGNNNWYSSFASSIVIYNAMLSNLFFVKNKSRAPEDQYLHLPMMDVPLEINSKSLCASIPHIKL